MAEHLFLLVSNVIFNTIVKDRLDGHLDYERRPVDVHKLQAPQEHAARSVDCVRGERGDAVGAVGVHVDRPDDVPGVHKVAGGDEYRAKSNNMGRRFCTPECV